MAHRAPWECTYAKEARSRCLPGKKPQSDQEYFEILALCILQAGLNWGVVRRQWTRYRKGFCHFNPTTLSRMPLCTLMKRPDIVRHTKKVESLLYNAREFMNIRKEWGSFSGFLDSLRRLKKSGAVSVLQARFKHVGPYTAEFYLHCVGHKPFA